MHKISHFLNRAMLLIDAILKSSTAEGANSSLRSGFIQGNSLLPLFCRQ
jgi:hypothetical protein